MLDRRKERPGKGSHAQSKAALSSGCVSLSAPLPLHCVAAASYHCQFLSPVFSIFSVQSPEGGRLLRRQGQSLLYQATVRGHPRTRYLPLGQLAPWAAGRVTETGRWAQWASRVPCSVRWEKRHSPRVGDNSRQRLLSSVTWIPLQSRKISLEPACPIFIQTLCSPSWKRFMLYVCMFCKLRRTAVVIDDLGNER